MSKNGRDEFRFLNLKKKVPVEEEFHRKE